MYYQKQILILFSMYVLMLTDQENSCKKLTNIAQIKCSYSQNFIPEKWISKRTPSTAPCSCHRKIKLGYFTTFERKHKFFCIDVLCVAIFYISNFQNKVTRCIKCVQYCGIVFYRALLLIHWYCYWYSSHSVLVNISYERSLIDDYLHCSSLKLQMYSFVTP